MRMAKLWRITLGVAWVFAAAIAARAADVQSADIRGLPDYRAESDLLAGVPGASSSLWAGMINPAAWPIQRAGGVLFAWSDSVPRCGPDDPSDWATVISMRRLAFGYQRHRHSDRTGVTSHQDEYTLGLGGGDRDYSWGISYSWVRGDQSMRPRHQRLAMGNIMRRRWLSVGTAMTWDLECEDNWYAIDIGLRPLGPRVTLFADAVQSYGHRLEEITLGGGLELRPIPGLVLGAKASDFGPETHFSLRAGVSLERGSLHPATHVHLNRDGERLGSTYVVETGAYAPPLGYGLLARGTRYPEVRLRGALSYRRYQWFDRRPTLLGTLRRLDAYAQDPRVGGVVVNISGLRARGVLLWELREQLAGLRRAGKRVVLYFDRAGMGAYTLASVADQVWMDPEGYLSLRGLTGSRMYVRRALDKLGVGVDEHRLFTYKSVTEKLSRTSMSDADRSQIGDYIDDLYESMARIVTTSRGMSREAWDRIIGEQADLHASEALAAGLVDSVGTFEEAKRAARRAPGRHWDDASSLDIGQVSGDRVWGPLEWGEPPRIAVLYAIGACAMDSGIKGRLLSTEIAQARRDPRVRAVVLRADSPGGQSLPSDLVSRELKKTTAVKPVIVSQGSMAASGGYWISMYGDSILASPWTVTGSIGVASIHYWNDGLGDRLGIDYDFVKRGEHADAERGMRFPYINMTLPERPLTDEERERAEVLIRGIYRRFVSKVAEGRGMTEEAVDQVGQGRIWSGTRGRELGLVDEIGGLWESLRVAKEAAGIAANRPVSVVEGPSLGRFRLNLPRPLMLLAKQEEVDAGDGPWMLPADTSWTRMLLGEHAFAQLALPAQTYLEYTLRAEGHPMLLIDPFEIGGLSPVAQ